uniref:Uncharacterized protein n=4 Tax=Aegilops tauschii subsp. strangulata TaxID=200361 RepID=A0A453EEN4_AEGTS
HLSSGTGHRRKAGFSHISSPLDCYLIARRGPALHHGADSKAGSAASSRHEEAAGGRGQAGLGRCAPLPYLLLLLRVGCWLAAVSGAVRVRPEGRSFCLCRCS